MKLYVPALALLLTACGGGSPTDNNNLSPPPPVEEFPAEGTPLSEQYCEETGPEAQFNRLLNLVQNVADGNGGSKVKVVEEAAEKCNPDRDGDGVPNEDDFFPDDPYLWLEQLTCTTQEHITQIDDGSFSLTPKIIDTFYYLNCDGQPQRTDQSLIYRSDSKEIARIGVLVYLDTGLTRNNQWVQGELDHANDLFERSKIFVELYLSGVIPIELSPTRSEVNIIKDMLYERYQFSNINEQMIANDADVAYTFANVREDQKICGVAYLNPKMELNNSKGYIQCYSDTYFEDPVKDRYNYRASDTFAHELGHNFGNNHDRANTSTPSGMFNYSYGYVVKPNTFDLGSVMSYSVGKTEKFSSPMARVKAEDGNVYQLGDIESDVRQSINRVRMSYSKISENPDNLYFLLPITVVNERMIQAR